MVPRTWIAVLLMSSVWMHASDDAVQKVADDCDIPMIKTSSEKHVHYAVGKFPYTQLRRVHYEKRPEGSHINALVMLYTAFDFPKTMCTFTSNAPGQRVSSHYVVTQDERCALQNGKSVSIDGGTVVRVVPEKQRAWYAGQSCWKGVTGLNDTAIGVDSVNYGFDSSGAWYPFDDKQIASIGALSQDIIQWYNIHPTNVVGHADIAPSRKVDPGVMFPWGTLHKDYGVGAWLENLNQKYVTTHYLPQEPLPQGISVPFVLSSLKQYGYPVQDSGYNTPENSSVVKAFKAHFSANQHPERCNDTITRDEMIWIWGLLSKYRT